MNLLPYPRSVRRRGGMCRLPPRAALHLDPTLPEATARQVAERLASAARAQGLELQLKAAGSNGIPPAIQAFRDAQAPDHPEGYSLTMGPRDITVHYRDEGGLR